MSELSHPPAPFRLLPAVDDLNRPFWTGGQQGELRFWRCQTCAYWIHPPTPLCPECLSKDLAVEAASGLAVVHTFSVNHQAWMPGLEPPYVVAIVALAEQDGLRLTTNVLDVDPAEVFIGMAVEVRFEQHEDVWIPVFTPSAGAA
jgi:uncharacterized OB-fold protein